MSTRNAILHLLWLLDEPDSDDTDGITVRRVAEELDRTEPCISQHLRHLAEAGLVVRTIGGADQKVAWHGDMKVVRRLPDLWRPSASGAYRASQMTGDDRRPGR